MLRPMFEEFTLPITEAVMTRKNGAHRELVLEEEPSAEERAAARRAARFRLRRYCVSCGRSDSVQATPARPGRCVTCGGTLLTELDPD